MESRELKMLSHHKNKARNKLEVDPEELLENIPTSTHSFAAFLHQSYLHFFTDIHDLSNAAENLSMSDPFFHEWTVSTYTSCKVKHYFNSLSFLAAGIARAALVTAFDLGGSTILLKSMSQNSPGSPQIGLLRV